MNKKILTLIIIISAIVLIATITSIILADKEDPEDKNKFIFENEYEVFVGQDEYLLKGFVGETPLNLRLRTDPRDIKNIPSEEDIKTKLFPTSLIFITLKPDLSSTSVIAAREISRITGHASLFRTTTLGALTGESDNEEVPVITCTNATQKQKVINLKLSDTTKISSSNNCIIIEGETEKDLIRAADKLVLQLLGIL